MNNEDNILPIITNVLGDPKRDYCSSGSWYEFNCPCCADENGGTCDNKYNFAVSLSEFYGHCWKCGYHGKLSKVIKKYGSQSDLDEYRDELAAVKEGRYFMLSGGNSDIDDVIDDVDLELPYGFRLIDKNDYGCREAYDYLARRGVDDYIIEKFKIGYVGPYKGKFSNRIVIPSYDGYGDLNYWVARDYTGKSYRKILNPDIDKKRITFNEQYVNWYEPVTLVEGPFDHVVVPNSIPLLGKSMDESCDVYSKIVSKANSTINIFLDDDATDTAYSLYKRLNSVLPGNVRVIECPDGYDASDYYREFGKKGIVQLMRSSHKLDDFTLSLIEC